MEGSFLWVTARLRRLRLATPTFRCRACEAYGMEAPLGCDEPVTLNLFQGLESPETLQIFFKETKVSSSFFFSFFKRPPKKRKMKQKEKKTGLGYMLVTSSALSSKQTLVGNSRLRAQTSLSRLFFTKCAKIKDCHANARNDEGKIATLTLAKQQTCSALPCF